MYGVLEARAQRRPDGGAELCNAARCNATEDSRAVGIDDFAVAPAQVKREIDAVVSFDFQREGRAALLLGGCQYHARQPRDLRARGPSHSAVLPPHFLPFTPHFYAQHAQWR